MVKIPYDELEAAYTNGGGEADFPQHCDNRDCQAFLENPLTEDGLEYVKHVLNVAVDQGLKESIIFQWAEFYGVSPDAESV